jgi:hypothetical protein
MTYFNPSLQIDILVDASPVEIGAIISQNQQTIAYASSEEIPKFSLLDLNNPK